MIYVAVIAGLFLVVGLIYLAVVLVGLEKARIRQRVRSLERIMRTADRVERRQRATAHWRRWR